MITPLMHILSCLDKSYKLIAPLDIFYLNKSDRDLVVSEAKRLCDLILDDERYLSITSDTELPMLCSVQDIAGTAKQLHPYTVLLLMQIKSCAEHYLKESNMVDNDKVDDDLSTDGVILRLEGNPNYIYYYVYSIMELPSLNYESKIAKLAELLLTIRNHQVVIDNTNMGGDNKKAQEFLQRLDTQSKLDYWRVLLYNEYIKYYGTVPQEFDESLLNRVKLELWDLGFYGFVNPLQMYNEFNEARMTRKVSVEIDPKVVEFLTRIVSSGGVRL